jgi:hypothetical protein
MGAVTQSQQAAAGPGSMPDAPPADPAGFAPGFVPALDEAHRRLCADLTRRAPALAERLLPWMAQRAVKGAAPTAYFTHPLAFPLLALPWWLEESLGATRDGELQTDLLVSSMSGYYLVRLIDDVMDGASEAEARLLPAVPVLHGVFQSTYGRWFERGHPFWQTFDAAWARCHEAAAVEATLDDIDEQAFLRVSAMKVSAGIIPLTAIAWQCHGGTLPLPWARLFPRLCGFHQRYNDLFDWKRDLDNGAVTHFLSEGRRLRRAGESVLSWVAREGLDREVQRLEQDLRCLRNDAAQIASPGLDAWLRRREALLDEAADQARAGFAAVAPLLEALGAGRA